MARMTRLAIAPGGSVLGADFGYVELEARAVGQRQIAVGVPDRADRVLVDLGRQYVQDDVVVEGNQARARLGLLHELALARVVDEEPATDADRGFRGGFDDADEMSSHVAGKRTAFDRMDVFPD